MKIKDFMDLDKLQSIQDQFSDATGLAVIIVDAEGNYVTRGSNFTDFCMKYTRGTEEGKRKCQQCDYESKGTYLCHAGLVDFSADIVVEGEKVGAVIGGQVLTREPDEEKFRQIAENLGIDGQSDSRGSGTSGRCDEPVGESGVYEISEQQAVEYI